MKLFSKIFAKERKDEVEELFSDIKEDSKLLEQFLRLYEEKIEAVRQIIPLWYEEGDIHKISEIVKKIPSWNKNLIKLAETFLKIEEKEKLLFYFIIKEKMHQLDRRYAVYKKQKDLLDREKFAEYAQRLVPHFESVHEALLTFVEIIKKQNEYIQKCRVGVTALIAKDLILHRDFFHLLENETDMDKEIKHNMIVFIRIINDFLGYEKKEAKEYVRKGVTYKDVQEVLTKEYFEDVRNLQHIAEETRKKILEKYGSAENFRNSLKKEVINTPTDKNLKKFYELYKTIFTIKEEQESYEGFQEVLGFNYNKEFLEKFGTFEEAILLLTDPETEDLVGAVDFTTYVLPKELRLDDSYGTSHIIYLFVKHEYRKLGIGSELLDEVRNYTKNFIDGKRGDAALAKNRSDIKVIYLCEQNAPALMSLKEYLLDNGNAKIDQCDRLVWWLNRGYRRLGFRYIQLPLEEGGETCEFLTLNMDKRDGDRIPSPVLHYHLSRFFGISVIKGGDLLQQPAYLQQKEELSKIPYVRFVYQDPLKMKKLIGGVIDKVMMGASIKDSPLQDILVTPVTEDEKEFFLKKLRIEPMTKKYLAVTIELLEKIFVLPEHKKLIRMHLPHSLKSHSAPEQGIPYLEYFIVREQSKRVIGCVGIYTQDTDEKEANWIGWMGIHPEYRNYKLGLKLLNFAIDRAKKDGKKYLRLYTSDHPNEANAVRLYESYGFKIFKKEPSPENLGYTYLYYQLEL